MTKLCVRILTIPRSCRGTCLLRTSTDEGQSLYDFQSEISLLLGNWPASLMRIWGGAFYSSRTTKQTWAKVQERRLGPSQRSIKQSKTNVRFTPSAKKAHCLDFNSFRDGQSILELDAKIPDSAIHLCMPKQKLDRAWVACLFINLGHFGPPH